MKLDDVALSEDGHLLSKNFHSSKIQRIIDTSSMCIPSMEDILKRKFIPEPKTHDEKAVRDFYKYSDPVDGDIIVYYDDTHVLSGTAGYALLRNGYVWSIVRERMS